MQTRPYFAQAHADHDLPIKIVCINASAEEQENNVPSNHLDPFVVGDLAFHWYVNDGVESDWVMNVGPEIRFSEDKRSFDSDVDGIGEINQADCHAENEESDKTRCCGVLSYD